MVARSPATSAKANAQIVVLALGLLAADRPGGFTTRPESAGNLPLALRDDFERSDREGWEFTDAKAWRVTASKSLILFGLAAGIGQDKYDASTDVGAHVAARPLSPAANAGPVSISQNLTRTNIFADLSMNLLLFKLNAEIGQVSGGTINTYNTFSGKQAADSRIYGSVGARFGF